QAPEKFEIPKALKKSRSELELGASLELGCWSLDLPIRELACDRVRSIRAVFVFQTDFLDFGKRNHHFLGGLAFADLGVHVVGRYARDAFDDVFTARRFDNEHHVFVRLPADHAEKAREFGLDKSPIEHERAALK